jgi:hypothetical protein
MQWAPDSPDLWAPDSGRPDQWAPDTFEHLTLGRGVDLFLGAKAAEGASPKTITWYRMILERAIAAFGADHPIDRVTGPDLRAWLVELRTTLAPFSVAGYVRTLKVFGNWLQAEELAEASALRARGRRWVPPSSTSPSVADSYHAAVRKPRRSVSAASCTKPRIAIRGS